MSTRETLKPALPRLDGVDVLRGISILGVILLHLWIRFAGEHLRMGGSWPRELSHLVFFNGGNGVTIFFAVSGFLITLTSIRRFGTLGQMRPLTFYRIRFARIMPLLLLLLVILSVLHLAHVDGFRINEKFFTLPRALFAALTFHLNWLETARNAWLPACWTVLWSLSIEETFYFFFPLVCLALMSRWRGGIWIWFAVALTLIALGPFARTVWPKTDLAAENSYIAGMSDIAVGCIAAWLADCARRHGWQAKQRALLWLQVAGALIVALVLVWPTWHHMLYWLGKSGTDDTLLALGTAMVCFAVALRNRPGSKLTAPLRWFGRHSYELYLFHEFVVLYAVDLYVKRHVHVADRTAMVLYVVVAVLLTAPLAWALAKWFAEPMNRRLRGARTAR